MVKELLALVLDKKELRGISESFAEEILSQWLANNTDVQRSYEEDPDNFMRTKEYARLRSEVREELRIIYGAFFTAKYASKKKKYVKELIRTGSEQARQELLSLHRSSKERLLSYAFVYQQLFANIPTPKSILDLGCGFNPFAYEYLGFTPAYHCADIACEDLELIKEYFSSLGVASSTHCVDVSKPENVSTLPRCEVAFAFKLFDSLEQREHDITKHLLEAIPADIVIVSFPTRSIGGKKRIKPRAWFERIVTNKVLFEVTLDNEQFYVITQTGKEGFTH
ncbi:MAG: hypothetical protein ACMXYD_04210 [Candidatus Woesearchaeota archaeon]